MCTSSSSSSSSSYPSRDQYANKLAATVITLARMVANEHCLLCWADLTNRADTFCRACNKQRAWCPRGCARIWPINPTQCIFCHVAELIRCPLAKSNIDIIYNLLYLRPLDSPDDLMHDEIYDIISAAVMSDSK